MPSYEITINGEIYDIDAPDDAAANLAASQLQSKMQGSAPKTAGDRIASSLNSSASGMASGIPIVGDYLNEGLNKAEAGLRSLWGPETYEEELAGVHAREKADIAANPGTHKAAEIAGGVYGTAPLMAAAPTMFGAGAAPLLTRTGWSVGSGLALGGADAGVRSGGDKNAMLWGAGTGALTGLAGPFAGAAIGKGVRAGMNYFGDSAAARAAGATRDTVQRLYNSILGDGMDAAALRAKFDKLGPNGSWMDVAPGPEGLAGGLANEVGEGGQIVRKFLNDRAAGANTRLRTAVDDTMGPNVIPAQVEAEIAGNEAMFAPRYRQVFQGAGPYDSTPIANALDDTIIASRGGRRAATRDVRQWINDENGLPTQDPRLLHETRMSIDSARPVSPDSRAQGAFDEARGFIDDALRDAVPGIKEQDAAFAELQRQRQGFSRGQQVLDSGRTSPRPAELANEIQQAALPQAPEQIGPSAVPFRMKQGARAEIDRVTGTNINDTAALKREIQGQGDWNRDRIGSLFGEDNANRLFDAVDAESVFANTRNRVTSNSESARRLANQRALAGDGEAVPLEQAFSYNGIKGLATAKAVNVGKKLIENAKTPGEEAAAIDLARALTSNNPALIDAVMRRQSLSTSSPTVDRLVRAILLGGGTAGARSGVNPAY